VLRQHFKGLIQLVRIDIGNVVDGIWIVQCHSYFARRMLHVLDPFIYLFVIVYLDDICIYFKLAEEHLDHRRKLLTDLRQKTHLKNVLK